jgi:heme-degrading monooxygenase HmoA
MESGETGEAVPRGFIAAPDTPVTREEPGTVIGRLWHGWTSRDKADVYEQLLRKEVLPGIHKVDGYKGAYLLRRDVQEGVEFVTLTLFESMDAVRAFAGEDYEVAVVPPKARELLSRFDPTSDHFEVVIQPD